MFGLGDLVDAVADVAKDVGGGIADAAKSVGRGVSDAAESAYDSVSMSSVGDAIAWGATAVDTVTFGAAGAAANAADDYVFDTVDYVTGGAINVDFDDGKFSVGTGIEGLAYAGASVGESGITASGEAIIGGNFDVRMTDDGFGVSGAAGIDWGPLPYAEGHVVVLPNGEVSVGGRAQGTLPTPYGIFSGKVDAGFSNVGEGWRTHMNSDGTWVTPTGVTLSAGQTLGYEVTDDGSHLTVGVEGGVGYVGYGKVGGEVGYERVEDDGDIVQGVHVGGYAKGYGMEVRAEADYVNAQVDGQTRSDWSGDVDFKPPDASDLAKLAIDVAKSEFGGDALPADDFSAAIETADLTEQSLNDLNLDL